MHNAGGEFPRMPIPRTLVHKQDGLVTVPPRVQGYRMGGVALQIAVIVVLALLNGLLAMSETALISSRKARLKQRAEAGDRGARAALGLAESPNRFLSTVQIGISLVGVLAGAFGGATLAPYAGPLAFGTVVVAITYLSLIIGELVPKRLALSGAEAVASRVAGPMRLLSAITAPAVWFLSVSTEGVLRLLGAHRTGAPPVSEQEVEILMEEGAQAGVFEEEERDLVRRALRLDADDPPEEILRRARDVGHSFFPVARGDLDDLLGIASVKEDWARQASGKNADLLDSLQRSPLVPEGAPATSALEAFKRSGLPVSLVIDERGHIEGLVTLTDVLEALIGEVPDEDEPAEAAIVRREDGSLMVDGLLGANELREHLGLGGLPREEEADYHTVGGMVMDNLGRVPATGDRFDWEGYTFEVLDMDGRRVDKVLITPPRGNGTEHAP